jgi:dihydrofolate reductase (trimethoprim resistance protein)
MHTFKLGDTVKKVSGSQWHGTVVGTYTTELTPEGYAVESWTEAGSVQIYPVRALEPWTPPLISRQQK